MAASRKDAIKKYEYQKKVICGARKMVFNNF